MNGDTTDRGAEIREQIAALQRELETIPPPPATVDAVLAHNRERADAPNALRPRRGAP